jgi:DNA invertase Pin-like site-specific DNA recombinase
VSRRFWFKNRDPAHWRDVWQVDAVVGKYIISDKSMTAEDWIRERSSTSSRETFTEIESGRNSERPALAKALAAARVRHVPIVVAKVDQLTRSVGFLSMLLDAGVDVRFADLPQIEGTAGRFMLKHMALVAELEAGFISDRTNAALAAAKRRGKKLGGFRAGAKLSAKARQKGANANAEAAAVRAADLAPAITELQASGATSLRAIASALNDRGIPTASNDRGIPRGGKWFAASVRDVLARI